jgi:hypothetical protein
VRMRHQVQHRRRPPGVVPSGRPHARASTAAHARQPTRPPRPPGVRSSWPSRGHWGPWPST